jgi:hypothetical protein
MKTKITAALFGLMVGGNVLTAQAATIFSDNFDSNAADSLNGSPAGWSVDIGVVDIIGAGGSFDWYPGNGSYIDLDGSAAEQGQLSAMTNSFYNLAAGTYSLSFDYGINHNDGLADTDQIFAGVYDSTLSLISFITSVDANALNHGSSTFTSYSVSFVLASAVTAAQFFIAGYSVGPVDQSGGIIDNFKIAEVLDATPEVPLPAGLLLLLSGLTGLGFLGRSRSKAA